ncbi:MAG TPA: adenine deaminase [Chryseosolibacter sp.]|nr:adenine deaminase [Chryseosolibacter sp.]
MRIAGYLVDIRRQTIAPSEITVEGRTIKSIEPATNIPDQFILPGFIDAHVHIESSMVTPAEFARMAVVHGTVATVSDPHEIGNVLGVKGVEYMIENGRQVPFKFYFGAPSCVPATEFETAGASIDVRDIEYLLKKPEIRYLAEMMNWPGVLNADNGVMAKIAVAKRLKRVVDGHAPGLRGELAQRYASAGITTDHECFTSEEALDKLGCGMKIIVREGSAAKNFDALVDLMHDHAGNMMFCSDDKHPDSLEGGHINLLVARAVQRGIDPFKVLTAACLNPADHYGLDVGRLHVGDDADFIVVDNLRDFKVLKTFIRGLLVAERGKTLIPPTASIVINNFDCDELRPEVFQVKAMSSRMRIILAEDSQLVTTEVIGDVTVRNGLAVADPGSDILKIAVVNRYAGGRPAVAFIRNFGLRAGAIASSVAHDSHNVIVVGTDDESMARAANLIIRARGGVSAVKDRDEKILALPVAGLMSDRDGFEVSRQYQEIDRMAKQMGSTLAAPFMTLSFMALLVIPSLKLSDKGLFNGRSFQFCDLFVHDEQSD